MFWIRISIESIDWKKIKQWIASSRNRNQNSNSDRKRTIVLGLELNEKHTSEVENGVDCGEGSKKPHRLFDEKRFKYRNCSVFIKSNPAIDGNSIIEGDVVTKLDNL